MCGRYSQAAALAKLAKRFGIPVEASATQQALDRPAVWRSPLKPRYNLAPSELAPAIVFEGGERRLQMMKWGISRQWSKDKKPYFITNLTVEKLPKGTFNSGLTQCRCLIPADGFYEWPQDVTPKIPFRFTMKDDSLFAFAAIYDEPSPNAVSPKRRSADAPMRTFTIFTTKPNPLVAEVHDLICTN